MPKPKIAFAWLASCGGCEESVVDLGETLLFELADQVEIVFWPVALDAKHADLAALNPGELAAAFVNGAVRTKEMIDLLELIRSRSQLLFAVGSCAHLGGIPSLGNVASGRELLQTAYCRQPSNDNPQGTVPSLDGEKLSPLTQWVHPLADCVPVDYVIPGCPPTTELMAQAITGLLAGELPSPQTVFGESRSLCHTCPHLDSKPDTLQLPRFKRVHQVEARDDTCLLAQGLLCLGPATRGGCGGQCLRANMPCRGCFGPPEGVVDQAAAILSFLAAHVPTDRGEQGVQEFVESVPDPVGTCYRFGLPRWARSPGEEGGQ